MKRYMPVFVALLLLGGGAWWVLGGEEAAAPAPDLGAPPPPGASPARPVAPLLTGRGGETPPTTAPTTPAPLEVAAPEGPTPEGHVALAGRVLETSEEGERGVAGIPVTLHHVDGDTLGPPVATARSAADGRFRMVMVEDLLPVFTGTGPVAQARASAPDGRLAAAALYGRPESGSPMGMTRDLPVGDMHLRRMVRVPVIVRGASPDVVAAIHVQPWTPSPIAGWSAPVPVMDGTPHEIAVPEEGLVRIAAVAAGRGRAVALLQFPRKEEAPVVLELLPQRDVTVRVVDDADDAPIPGALVTLKELVRSPRGSTMVPWWPAGPADVTADDGTVHLRGQPEPAVTVHVEATAEGYPPVDPLRGSNHRLGADTNEVTIRLKRAVTARLPIADDSPTIPPEGAVVPLRARPGSGSATPLTPGRIEAGHLVIDGCSPHGFGAEAVAANGDVARFWFRPGAEAQEEIAFRPTRTITVRVRDADGQPAVGAGVTARNQGNNVLAGPLTTDADGVARLTSLAWLPYDALVDVYVGSDPFPFGGRNVGSVNLVAGDAELEATLPRTQRIVAHVTVEGRPVSPPGFVLFLQGYVPLQPVEGQPGRMEGEWTPSGTTTQVEATAGATGFLSSPVVIDLPEDAREPLEFSVDLKRGGAFRMKVIPPSDNRTQILAQRWNPDTSSWGQGGAQALGPVHISNPLRPDTDGWIIVSPVAAGRYRLVDASSGVASQPVDVQPGRETPDGLLDLSRTGWVKGRAELPEGTDQRMVVVVGSGEGLDAGSGPPEFNPLSGGFEQRKGLRAHFNPDGMFWLRVPGDRPITLHLEGHGIRPARGATPVVVTAPREDVLLRGEAAPLARLRLATPLKLNMNPGRPRACTVDWTHGAAGGQVAAMLSAQADVIEISGLAPGTGTLWIDAGASAPIELRDVTIPADRDVDLGEVTPEEGRRLAIRIIPPTQGVAPRLTFFVRREGPRSYHRRLDLGTLPPEGGTYHVKGLEPGPHTFNGSAIMGGPTGAARHEEIDIPADTELQITIDLSKP